MTPKRRLLPSALLFAACSSTSMTDAGPDAGPDPCLDFDAGHDDSGVRCMCASFRSSDGTWEFDKCCDPDIGNPCPVCCYNPRDADGGRQYYPDGGPPICAC